MSNQIFKGLGLFFLWSLCGKAYGQILLQEPVNNQTLITNTPFFDWTDVPGTNRFYIKIVELGVSQSPIAALNSNPSVHQNIIYGSSAYYYPLTATALENCKEYVWIIYTVTSENRNQHDLGNLTSYIQYISAPGVFKIACSNIVPNSNVRQPYFELQHEVSPFIHEIQDDTLRVKFRMPYNTDLVKYKIVNSSGTSVQSSDSLAVHYGLNYQSIVLGSSVSSQVPYSIYIDNGKGNIIQGKFKIKD